MRSLAKIKPLRKFLNLQYAATFVRTVNAMYIYYAPLLKSVVVECFRLSGRWFETHHWQCVLYLSKTLYLLLSNGSAQEDRKHPDMTEKLLTRMYKASAQKHSSLIFIK